MIMSQVKGKRLNGDSKMKKKNSKMKNIYTPRPGGSTSDDEEDPNLTEQEQKNGPAWSEYFAPDDLLGRYEPIREIGRGSYGIVYEGKALKKVGKVEIGTRVAIKKVQRVFHTETDAKRLLRELRILRILRNHDSIVSMYDIIPPKDPKRFAALTIVFQCLDADLGIFPLLPSYIPHTHKHEQTQNKRKNISNESVFYHIACSIHALSDLAGIKIYAQCKDRA